MTHNEPVDDDLIATLKDSFGVAGFVDLTIMAGYYGMLARFINTVGVPVEDSYSDITFNKVA